MGGLEANLFIHEKQVDCVVARQFHFRVFYHMSVPGKQYKYLKNNKFV